MALLPTAFLEFYQSNDEMVYSSDIGTVMKLYDYLSSGNGYKVRLLLAFLGLPYDWEHVDLDSGAARKPDYSAINPNCRIPALALDGGTVLSESNAILNYLADGTGWLPQDRLARAQVLQWQFFEQYDHEPTIAVIRAWTMHPDWGPQEPAARAEAIAAKRTAGEAALTLMDAALADGRFLVGGAPSIADISLYAYTHVAGDGGFDLSAWPNIAGWIARVEALHGYVPITYQPA